MSFWRKYIESLLAVAARYPSLKRIVDTLIRWLFSGVTDFDRRSEPMWSDAYSDVT